MNRQPPVGGFSIGGLRPLLPWLLATWFVAISAMRMLVIASGGPGFDGRLYRTATVSWLAGGDPWLVSQGGVYFGAPPPSLLPMIPFAILPEAVGVGALLALGVVSSAWAIRRLRLPLWWLAFPPLVDGMWNANPHVLIMPLIVAGLAPVAVVIKVYGGVVPLMRFEVRALLLSALALAVTAPFLPWRQFLDDLPFVLSQLRLQSNGGLSVWAAPLPWLLILAVIAVGALLVIGRERAAWWAVPVLWPSTQWYYASIAIPGMTGSGPWLLGAAILAVPLEFGPIVALLVCAAGVLITNRGRGAGRGEPWSIWRVLLPLRPDEPATTKS
jgi:hypothetical protein